MLFNALLLRGHQLDEKVVNGKMPKPEELVPFLDSIIFSFPYIRSIKKTEKLLVLFRKWKTFINHHYAEVYNKSIDKNSKFYQQCFLDESLSVSLPSIGLIETNSADNRLLDLSRYVDPYKTYYPDFKKINNPELYQREYFQEIMVGASDLFKECRLEEAEELYLKGIGEINNKRKINYNDLYLLSWAAHGLGNIHFIFARYKIAKDFFFSSLELKNKIPHLPPLFQASTESKFITTKISDCDAEEWNSELRDFYIKITSKGEQLIEENEKWYFNIKEDLKYQIAKSYCYMNDYKNSKKNLNESIRIGTKYKDYSGLVRSYVLLGALSQNFNSALDKIESNLKIIQSENHYDPYVRRIVTSPNLDEIKVLNRKFAIQIVELFTSYDVYPLDVQQ